ncbi:hypothetical protein [Candidatus Xianfuyuplasma coldseepsis]|uniref:Uncharacterized protein n=1 Tax=Candidatus Xianfuyuplasma coldseepsis TaxID=2782163 RepID=A0A7L7KQN9_9MOLU|nr:hypothetical protein [Xianfuyuplasma coldseepsis]QMS84264.1 hypothetical protein G4Z02_00415 [Xianfuyuplasma coldseepsis]
MILKVDSKVIMAFSAAIGTAFIAGATSGIVLYKNRSDFSEWFDNKMYPAVKQIVLENGPTALRVVIVKALEHKPAARKAFLDIVDTIEKGKVKVPKKLEKELFQIKDELPEVLSEVEKLAIEAN